MALFAELARFLIDPLGRAGLILPTGIATDFSRRLFFGDLVENKALVSFFAFKNEEFMFAPPVEHTVTFGLLTYLGSGQTIDQMEFTWFAYNINHMQDPARRILISTDDLALFNPNTRTCPIFRTKADSDLTRKIYQNVPVLIDESKDRNPWNLHFQLMFMMNTDSGLFRSFEQLEPQGYRLIGNFLVHDADRYLPLYEAKLMHQFDHRFGTYLGMSSRSTTMLPNPTPDEYMNPEHVVLPWYWVHESEVSAKIDNLECHWLLGFRDIARATDVRTAICSFLPRVAAGNKVPLLVLEEHSTQLASCLAANFNSLAFDYVIRQKVGGTSLNFYIIKQLPVLAPSAYTSNDVSFITPCH